MNKTSLFSLLAVLIFIAAAVFSATHPRRLADTTEISTPETPSISPGSDVMPSVPGIAMDSLAMIRAAQNQISGSSAPATQANNISDPRVFWVKVAFSAVFCIAALWVVLSGKYDAETKKWAFSVLTLIAGVWIGSVI
jgi:uncharacterized membrane protein YedE/YeeE